MEIELPRGPYGAVVVKDLLSDGGGKQLLIQALVKDGADIALSIKRYLQAIVFKDIFANGQSVLGYAASAPPDVKCRQGKGCQVGSEAEISAVLVVADSAGQGLSLAVQNDDLFGIVFV